MRLFFDFEFDPISREPISFGIVSALDDRMYVEFSLPAGLEDRLPTFTQDTVLPLLQKAPGERIKAKEFSNLLANHLLSLCENHGIKGYTMKLICDSEADRELLQAHAMSTLIPIEVIDFRSYEEMESYQEQYNDYFDPVLRPRHHALNDALAIRDAFQKMAEGRLLSAMDTFGTRKMGI